MTKSQIIEILDKYEDYILGGDINDELADAILALPIEMPMEEEIYKWADSTERPGCSYWKGLADGAKWMKDEIIKRKR